MTKKTSSVRARALVHMQALLATSAAVEACHPKSQVTDSGADAVAFGPPKAPDASTDTPNTVADVPDANATTTERDHGYMVVDPVPRPAYCPDVAQHIRGKATRSGDNVVVTLSPPSAGAKGHFKYVAGQAPTVYGGTLVSHKVDASGVTITFTPAAKDTYVSIGVKGSCDQGFVTINAGIAASTLAVSLSEY